MIFLNPLPAQVTLESDDVLDGLNAMVGAAQLCSWLRWSRG